MSNMDMNEVNANLEKINKMFNGDSFLQRLKILFAGINAPRSSREYKAAMIEMQRLAAPVSAILLPVMLLGLMAMMSTGSSVDDRIIQTQVLEADEVKQLDEIEEVKPPEDQMQETDIDIPVIDDMSVQVNTDVATPDTGPVSPQPQAFDAVMTVKSPVILKNVFGSIRNTGTRGAQMARFGGDKQTEEAVMRALRWLKKNQNKDGSWSRSKVAMTGLGILTFLSHGEKPGESAEFGETVRKALDFLINNLDANGRFKGVDGNEYGHLIACYALCEAYGMTLNPNVKSAAERAMVRIVKGQHPTGGWTYKLDPGQTDGKYRDDTSYMGWCAQALKAAKLARLQVDGLEKAIKLSIQGFKNNAHPDGGFGYVGPGKGGLTSVGVLCMQLLGASNDPDVKKGLAVIGGWSPAFQDYSKARALVAGVKPEELIKRGKDGKPVIDKKTGKEEKETALAVAKRKMGPILDDAEKAFLSGSAQYYYYYATQCKFHEGGRQWDRWNREMKPRYVKAQQIEREAIEDDKGIKRDIGWWENMDNHGDRPVMDTCLAALQLMVYYRYLPTTTEAAVRVEEEITATASDTDDIVIDIGNM